MLITFFSALVSSFILIPLTIVFAKKFDLVDDPKKRNHPGVIHKKIIPRAGGLGIFLSFAIVTFAFIPITKAILGIVGGGLILVILGLVDDKRELGKGTKLLFQLLSALVVVGAGVGIAFITNPFSLIGIGADDVIRLDTIRYSFELFGSHSILILANLFALLWIIWVINMVNFSSGVDGQLPGISLVAFIILFIVSSRLAQTDPSQVLVAKLALIGAGSTLGFLAFNFAPAKIFPGDSGSYFLGFLIAVLSIISGAKVGTALLVMAVPLVDGVFTIIRRILSGKSPFSGDRGHLHHKLLELGLSQRKVALFYWIFCAILGAIALSLNSAGKVFAVFIIGVAVLGGLLWINLILHLKGQK